jgi:ABC-2 type transport system permease protein
MIPLVMINGFVSNPDSSLSIALSYFPLTSPIVMLIRVLVSRPAFWELALSYGLLLASVLGAAVFAAKIFRIGILMTGKKRKLGEILRWFAVK